MRLLIDRQDDFLTETREMLRAGLETADWVIVDDTGARHRGANGVRTQIGNDTFAWFSTTGSKSRLNFLDLLRAGHTDYVINDAALEYLREHAPRLRRGRRGRNAGPATGDAQAAAICRRESLDAPP